MQDDDHKDILKLFDNLLNANTTNSEIPDSIIKKIEVVKHSLNSDKLDKEKMIKLSEEIDNLIKSKELKQKKDFLFFEEFKNYLEKKK